MDEVIVSFLTWTTYGTWLRGDARGWVDGAMHEMHPEPDPTLESADRQRMKEPPVLLTPAQRRLVEETIRAHCLIRGWELIGVNVRSNHAHVLVRHGTRPSQVMEQFKAWATRRLKEGTPTRTRWWTEGGSRRQVQDDEVEGVLAYVKDGQDGGSRRG